MDYCEFQTLHHCESGYVVLCKHCNSYQVAFGTVILNLQQDEYKHFLEYLYVVLKKRSLCDEPQKKIIQIPTDSARIAMIFSTEEVERLIHLLQQAELMNQIYETLK